MAGVNNRVKITNDIELKDRLVAINRVTKVTKGGRTFSFSAIVVVGNEEGIIGWGLGKAGEVTAAIAKGVESAKKNLVKVPVLKGIDRLYSGCCLRKKIRFSFGLCVKTECLSDMLYFFVKLLLFLCV